MLEFETRVAGFIKSESLFGAADRVLLAVSGGADSVALLHTMHSLKAEGIFDGQLHCAHINHCLRGAEADLDEEFVRGTAEQSNLPISTRRVDVRKFAEQKRLSIETAGRQLRTEALLEIAQQCGCKCVATGHQKNDNAETLIQRLARGTGFRGLGGIRPVRELGGGIRFVRPLLCVTRDEIIEYLRARNLKWRVDRTNFDCTYRRNFIRHRVLPVLQEDCSGSVAEKLSELAAGARRFYDSLSDCANAAWAESADCCGDEVTLDLKKFSMQHPAVQVELVRRCLVQIGSGERDLTQRHYEGVLRLAQQNVGGSRIALPNGFIARREYGKMVFSRTNEKAEASRWQRESIELRVPGKTTFGPYLIEASFVDSDKDDLGGWNMDSCLRRNDKVGINNKVGRNDRASAHAVAGRANYVERFDFQKVTLPLVVRGRQAGDRFRPLGLAGQKKVGKFLTSAKVPPELRDKVLIIADREKVIWVWPIRMSEQAKVDRETHKILQLRITDKHRPNRQKQE